MSTENLFYVVPYSRVETRVAIKGVTYNVLDWNQAQQFNSLDTSRHDYATYVRVDEDEYDLYQLADCVAFLSLVVTRNVSDRSFNEAIRAFAHYVKRASASQHVSAYYSRRRKLYEISDVLTRVGKNLDFTFEYNDDGKKTYTYENEMTSLAKSVLRVAYDKLTDVEREILTINYVDVHRRKIYDECVGDRNNIKIFVCRQLIKHAIVDDTGVLFDETAINRVGRRWFASEWAWTDYSKLLKDVNIRRIVSDKLQCDYDETTALARRSWATDSSSDDDDLTTNAASR